LSVPTRWAVTSCVFDPLADEVLEIVDTEQVRVVQDADALAGSCGVPVPVRARPVRGQAAVKTSLPWPCTGRIAAACPEIFNMLADSCGRRRLKWDRRRLRLPERCLGR
jgi:hypothetical protein